MSVPFNPYQMKIKTLLLLAAVAFALAGCSTPTQVDNGRVRAQTFNFITRKPQSSPVNGDPYAPIHAMIQEAIVRDLAQKGLSQVPAGGDVTVAYLIITGNNASTASITDYFGSRDDATTLHNKAQKAYTGSKDPNHFEAGTLVIDLIDSKTFELLWRHHASRPMLQNPTADARAARIQEVVDEILREVQIVP